MNKDNKNKYYIRKERSRQVLRNLKKTLELDKENKYIDKLGDSHHSSNWQKFNENYEFGKEKW
jgi:hypothetical protein